MLGDSTTFGIGADASETVPALLESRLNQEASSPQPYEVINAGVPGYGTAQERLLYRQWAHDLDPDLVILMFLITNDVQDNMCFDKPQSRPCFTLEQDKLVLREKGARATVSASAGRDPQSAGPFETLHSYVFFRERLRNLVTGNPAAVRSLSQIGLQFGVENLPPTLLSWYQTAYATEGWQITQALLEAVRNDTHGE